MQRLSSEEAAQLLAGSASVTRTFDRTPAGVINRAVDNVRRSYPELMATLDERDWSEGAAAFCRLNIPVESSAGAAKDAFVAEGWICTALLRLIDEGTITPALVTAESLADLKKLRFDVAYHNLLPQEAAEAVVETTPQPVTVDPVDQCTTDYRALGSTEFRKRWMTGDARAIYDRACASGRI